MTTQTPRRLRPPKLWRETFIEALRSSGNITLACKHSLVDRRTAYRHRDRDKEFAAAWDEAMETAVDLLEGEARRRAYSGVERPIFQRGEQVGVEKVYSDNLLMFLLCAHRPDMYRRSSRFEVSGPGGGPVKVEDAREQLTSSLARLVDRLSARSDPPASAAEGGS